MGELTVRRVDFGYFVRPAEETGTGAARVEPCLGYLVGHPDGLVLLGVSEFWQIVIKGIVIIVAVVLDQLQRRIQWRASEA